MGISNDAEQLYRTGKDLSAKDPEKAAEYFMRAGDLGHIPSKRELGILCLTGKGVPADTKKAYSLLSEAAVAMDPEATYNLALMYENGIGVGKDIYEALKLFAFAANMEYPGADMDADRVEDIIRKERQRKLRSRPLLRLDISDVDIEAACCKEMFDSALSETVVVIDTFKGPELVGEDEKGFEIILKQCPYCGKPVNRVSRDRKY